MIIIDQGADRKLIRALREPAEISAGYFLHLYPISGNPVSVRSKIISCTQQRHPDSQMYICDDGEIFVHIAYATAKECRKTMLEISDAVHVHPVELLGVSYDVAAYTGQVLSILEGKIEERRQAEEAFIRAQAAARAAALAARRRQEILEQGTRRSAEQIAAQRRLRGEPIFMIIEDDPFSRRLVENVLQKQYAMHGLDSGQNALSIYSDIAPDILFLDINLPDVTGHELLEKIIALDPQAYVVMISGNADKSNILQAMEHGAVGFVAKPFSRERLFQYIERCPTLSKEKVQ